jgi:Bardet-Biedl syndrome 9 protein
VLGKTGKDGVGAGAAVTAAQLTTPLVPLKDTLKLKKHMQMVCERLAKGMRLVAPPDEGKKKKAAAHSQPQAVSPSGAAPPAAAVAPAAAPAPAAAAVAAPATKK